MVKYAELLPPSWKSLYLPFWFQEDFPALDFAGALLGDGEASGQILFKSAQRCVLAGRPFVDGIFEHLHCRAQWMVEEGEWIQCPQAIATVTGPAANLLKAERLALNLLARAATLATRARITSDSKSSAAKLAGTRKTTPGFRLVEKYALVVGGVDPHRFSCTDCIMLKDNHIDFLRQHHGIDLETAIKQLKAIASFTSKVEVECRTIKDVEIAIASGANVVMLDNFIPSGAEMAALKALNTSVTIELSGGITRQNIHLYPDDESIVLSLGSLTHSPGELLDFSFKLGK